MDEMVDNDRPTNKDRYARNSSWPGALSSTKGRIHLRRLVFSTTLFPCSRAADHTFSSKWNGPHWKPVNPTAFELSRWRGGRCGVEGPSAIGPVYGVGHKEVYCDPSSAVDVG